MKYCIDSCTNDLSGTQRTLRHFCTIQAAILATVALAATFSGQMAMAQAADAGGQSLQDAANDPTAALMAFQLQDFYSACLHNSPETANSAQVRAAVPCRLWGRNHIGAVGDDRGV